MVGRKIGSKWFIRLQKGEEVVQSLKEFCEQNQIKLGSISGIGACKNVTMGLYDPQKKEYFKRTFPEDMEMAALLGNVSTMNQEIYLHLHATFSNEKLEAVAGHLNEATICATGEIIIDQVEGTIDRKKDEEIGINLWQIL